MSPAKLSIAIVGAGMGGLSAAVSLHQAGFDVQVYEQSPELNEVGGGLNLGPNATRLLYRLGLGEGLDRDGVRPVIMHQRRWDDGRTLLRTELQTQTDVFGAPQMTIHRADLQRIIAAALPSERLHLGHRLVSITDLGEATEARFENGVTITADVLIGADGIHSAVRAALFGEEDPKFSGCVAYRGLVPAERIAALGIEPGNYSWWGPDGHLIHYLISGGRTVNFVGWKDHENWSREDWTDKVTIERALAAYEGWHPQARAVIAAADTCYIWALYDRDPLPRWSVGRTTLLGDACHPMYPFMAQGAAQAIEDGAALTTILLDDAGRDTAAALKRYEQIRLPRVTTLQKMSRANKLRYHMQDGPEQQARDAALAQNNDRSPDAMRWLYGFDAGAIENVT